ncbi:LysR family transcriptional regulator [Motiliproteus sp. MSK22-1]|uniref:LysR family transcriptional regulator n=1 Tax=Motiliproteus sp. MSK22-1 TaxID=1897630 RepID=UPI000976E68A|nr:LysR family transcriptional regulator [Motiliproteus sp. MSK22-1]OMH33749.1 LysR family transcriptional regulator [Motiliproteus sp. MSK22-1]
MRLDIEALRVLDIIIQQGSFAKAAEKLCKAQSAVSYQIKKLEQQLGFDIFDRSHYRAELTPKGQVLWSEGRRMLELASRIETLAERYSEGWEPSFELVIDGSLPMEPVMRALKTLVDKDIPTKTQVKVEALGGVQMRFEHDHSDLMLVKDYHPAPNLKAIPLPPITFILVASPEHPLATQQQISLDQLYDHVELTIQDTSENKNQKLDALQFGGDRVFYMHGFTGKKTALLMGLGFGWMPTFMIDDELTNKTLIELNYVGGSQATFTPQLVFDTGRPLGKAGQMVTDLILDEFQTFDLASSNKRQ